VPPKHSAKIPLSEVTKLEHLIDQEPVCAPSEVSKRQAVAMLAPKLYEMRRKGYAWRDVAAWLSGHGLTVTTAALQRHMRALKASSARGSPRGRTKGSSDGKPDASPAPAASTPVATVEPKAEPPKGAPGFTVRPDRKVI
jgi:hypothetical protein